MLLCVTHSNNKTLHRCVLNCFIQIPTQEYITLRLCEVMICVTTFPIQDKNKFWIITLFFCFRWQKIKTNWEERKLVFFMLIYCFWLIIFINNCVKCCYIKILDLCSCNSDVYEIMFHSSSQLRAPFSLVTLGNMKNATQMKFL